MAVIGASPAAPARSYAMILVVALIVLGLAGAGVYLFKRSSAPTAGEPATNMMLMEGLHISNASGSLETNGDLLISGAVENSSDKERAAWYIVVDVFDANGRVMNKLKLLNGKQLYTRSDYDMLAKRGVNIQEFKARAIQRQGVVIPPKGAYPSRYATCSLRSEWQASTLLSSLLIRSACSKRWPRRPSSKSCFLPA